MANWKKIIGFQISMFVLFKFAPPPISEIGVLPVFWAFKFYKALLLALVLNLAMVGLYWPIFSSLFTTLSMELYYGQITGIFADYLGSGVDYCYESFIQKTFTFDQVNMLNILFILGWFILTDYAIMRLIRKHIVQRAAPFL